MSARVSKRKDRRMMGQALALARLNHGLTGKNPSVGCVILNADGCLVGEGMTAPGGTPHAEEEALAMAGHRAKGGTAYVTLEPCRERTSGAPSCSQKLIEAGVERVVCAIEDPHPIANGGFERLRKEGVRVEVGLKRTPALELYRDFFTSLQM